MDWTSSDSGCLSSELEAKRCRKETSKQEKQQQHTASMKSTSSKQPRALAGLVEVHTKPTKEQPSKLLSSKSLSMLVPRNLFFRKSLPDTKKQSVSAQEKEAANNQLQTTKSFPANFFRPIVGAGEQQHCKTMVNSTHLNIKNGPVGCSVLVEPSSVLNTVAPNSTILKLNSIGPNLSPIICSAGPGEVIDMSWSESASSASNSSALEKRSKAAKPALRQHKPETATGAHSSANRSDELNNNKRTTGSRFKNFKSTGLVLRDVKNSLGLRIKAKQESKAFVKLINESATTAVTPTKLYSPFDIYTDTSATKAPGQTPVGLHQAQKASAHLASRRKLGLKNPKTIAVLSMGENESLTDTEKPVDSCTPKGRIVQQHKRHLMQTANTKFTFDSPAGRHCETVKDVERFQQCIEDISKAIQTRGRSRTGAAGNSLIKGGRWREQEL